jgi:hypothetical protein
MSIVTYDKNSAVNTELLAERKVALSVIEDLRRRRVLLRRRTRPAPTTEMG